MRFAGQLRSLAELEFLLSLTRCQACGTREAHTHRMSGGVSLKHRRVLAATLQCTGCEAQRTIDVESNVDLTAVRLERFQLGDDRPSSVITAEQFSAELTALTPEIVDDVEQLPPAAWRENGAKLDRAITCLVELRKFSDDALNRALATAETQVVGAAPRARLDAEWARLCQIDRRRQADAPRAWAFEPPVPVPRGELTSEALQRHLEWVRRGGEGAGRLDIANIDGCGRKIGSHDLTRARLESVQLARADLAFATLDRCELTACDLTAANLGRCGFVGAQLVECRLDDSALGLARFQKAVVTTCSFDRAHLHRTSWQEALVSATSFHSVVFENAAFDGARFEDCDMRAASFALAAPQPMGTMDGAVFVRCDLRDTEWHGRDTSQARFVDCRRS